MKYMETDKIIIKTDGGVTVKAVTPVVISASRSTDIPAFYAQWFFNRLAKGYCSWINPFNQQRQYISFSKCKVVVFWTKNPKPILPFLYILDELGIHYYFQFTLNDYEDEGFEPNLPSLEDRIKTFKELSNIVGPDRIIWRFDPIILGPFISPRSILTKIWHIGNLLRGYTNKLVFSFVDIKAYRKVKNNLVKETSIFTEENVELGEGVGDQQLEIVKGLVNLREIWGEKGWNLTLATCAESIDLESYGIDHNCCIDGQLIAQLFGEDMELLYYLRTGKLLETNLFGFEPNVSKSTKNLKDKGQRKLCGCMVSKDIGMYNTCQHFCVYCYANTSKKVVMENLNRHSDNSESIID